MLGYTNEREAICYECIPHRTEVSLALARSILTSERAVLVA